jgi:hypothetical protein
MPRRFHVFYGFRVIPAQAGICLPMRKAGISVFLRTVFFTDFIQEKERRKQEI